MKPSLNHRLGCLALALAATALPIAGQAAVAVHANDDVTSTGLFVDPHQRLQLSSTGQVNLALFDGPYVTDAQGTIVQAPPPGSGAYGVFSGWPPSGPPVVGGFKVIPPYYPDRIGQLQGARFGELLAGFSTSPTPTTFSDFLGGFHAVGSHGQVTAPTVASYLFLAVNDINRADNGGTFHVSISAVPEPSPMIMAALGWVALALAARRKSPGGLKKPRTPSLHSWACRARRTRPAFQLPKEAMP